MKDPQNTATTEIQPVTSDRWDDLVELFASRGTVRSCWCMWFRTTSSEFNSQGGVGNKEAMRQVVADDLVPGLLAYVEGQPVGWCSIAPREEYGRIERSHPLKRVDDKPVWAVVCFYVPPEWRKRRVAEALLGGAVSWAAEHGAQIVEAYPRIDGDGPLPDDAAFTGPISMFKRAGFKEVARRSERQPIFRFDIEKFLHPPSA